MPHQEVSSELVEVLDRVYSEGTMMIGSMHPDDSIGMGHAADCLSFTLLHIGSVEGMRDSRDWLWSWPCVVRIKLQRRRMCWF